ncbi:protein of unknown function [Oscillibacter sp. PC13]|uniref:carbohydrate-binding domain-containing protein n=1 Tax=Oscillibacter sp. PC13 TaxID=1855299 RepID=UPI0008E5F062|nr:carbohydrate-binding domain-containing protein [Oscillibacter sp. PC13]SFP84050.1 protein of unknown function [Oscillibacter sp. PC13]
MKKISALISGILACIMILTACDAKTTDGTSSEEGKRSGDFPILGMQGVDAADMFTDRDLDTGYEDAAAGHVTLNGRSAESDTDAVQIADGIITITEEGTYVLSGTLNDGMVVVDAEKTDKIQLVLNGVSIRSSTSAAIYVKQADKVFITLADGTQNSLQNGGQYVNLDDSNIDAVVFSKDDLTFNGTGAVTINGAANGHGVVSKDDLVIADGTYEIVAASHGLSGKDSVRIAGSSFAITAGKDGIHAENDENTDSGFLYIANGKFSITSGGDGLSGEGFVQVDDGCFDIISGGGTAAAAQTAEEDAASAKAVKGTGGLYLNGGSFTIDSARNLPRALSAHPLRHRAQGVPLPWWMLKATR